MKHLKLFFACMLMAVLSIGQVWGEDQLAYTIEFQPTTSSTAAKTTSNFVSDLVTSGASYISSCTATARTYPDVNQIKLGSSSGTGSFTLSLSESGQVKATKVVLSAKYYDSGKTIKLTANSTSETFTPTNAFVDYELTLDGTADLTTITVESVTASKGRMYVNAIKVYVAAEVPSCTSEITITKGDNPANGTFVIDNSGAVCIDEGNATVNVTATPSAGYHLATVTSTVGTVGSIDGNNCAITNISASTTINVTFAANPKYTVSFNVGGSTAAQADITEASAGAGITLPAGPTPTCSADGWTFAGWAAAAVASETTTAPTLLSGTYHPTANVTLYAVYKRSEGAVFDGTEGGDFYIYAEISGTKYYATAFAKKPASTTDVNSAVKYTFEKIVENEKTYFAIKSGNAYLSYGTSGTDFTFTGTDPYKWEPTAGTQGTWRMKATTGSNRSIIYRTGTTNAFAPYSFNNIDGSEYFDVEIGGGTTYYLSAPSCSCEPLDAPIVTVTNKTYNGAKLTWATVANAAKYVVKFNGEDHEVTNNYYDATGLTPSTQYTYQVKALAAANQDDYCDSEFSTAANFTTEAAPTAHLTLMNLGEEHASSGDYAILTPFNLPTTAAACSKAFVGWDADPDCATAPTYAKGAEFTFANTTGVTLYAVYADETPGEATLTKLGSTYTPTANDNLVIVAVDEDNSYALYRETTNSSYVKYWVFDNNVETVAADAKKYVTLVSASDGKFYLGDATNGYVYSSGSNNLSVASTQTAWTIAWDNTANAFTFNQGRYLSCRSDLTGGNQYLYRLAGSTPAGIYKFDVYKYGMTASTYSNYATTCEEPLADPTFSLNPAVIPVDDKYTQAINVVITNNDSEGTIYYTTNGQNPTSASTEYAEPIVLNKCGSTTIKAIVISATNQSAIASATYEIALPIPSVSAEDPYTEAEAVAVIDGGCYNNEDVWVRGTVQTATFYSSSNTYTITLTNGFQFYKFKDLNGEEFSEDYIVAGDVLVAKGNLGKHNTTYQLGEGCYLVSRTAASKESIESDIDNPLSVAAAIGYIDNATTYDLSEDEFVAGVVSSITENAIYDGTYDIIVLDETDATKQIKFYGCDVKTFEGIKQYDQIIGKGKLTKYYTTYELNYPCEVAALTPYVAPVIAVISVELDETAITLKEGSNTTLIATVNPDNASNKAVIWSTSNENVATVVNGTITAVAEGNATITVKSEADPTISATCTVTVIDASARVLPNAVFQKVTATADITDGQYLIVYEGNNTHNAVAFDGALETLDAVGNTIDVTIDGDFIVAPADAAFTINVTAGTLKSYSGKYIGRSSNSNGLETNAAPLTNAFAITDGKAVITSTGNPTLRYNYASDQIRFRYYKSGQQDIQLYKMLEPETVRGELNEGDWGTICPKQTVMLPAGASFFTIAYVKMQGDMLYKIYFDEIAENESLKAGHPYIYIANSDAITGVKVGIEATEGINDHGFIGVVADYVFQVDASESLNSQIYVVYQNQIMRCKHGWYKLGAEKAYLDATDPTLIKRAEDAPQPAPGRRRVSLENPEAAPAITTDIDNVSEGNMPVKVIIDNQLFILRGERMYDATGRLVK